MGARFKYRVGGDEPEATRIAAAPMPRQIFPRALASVSPIARIIVDKHCDGLPLNRQEDRFARQGVPLDRGTMCRWLEHAGATAGATVIQAPAMRPCEPPSASARMPPASRCSRSPRRGGGRGSRSKLVALARTVASALSDSLPERPRREEDNSCSVEGAAIETNGVCVAAGDCFACTHARTDDWDCPDGSGCAGEYCATSCD